MWVGALARAVAQRPVWHDAGDDPEAVAALLERAASEAPTALDPTPRPPPAGADGGVLHQAAMLVARQRLSERHAEGDRVVAESVRAMDDLARATNLLGERLAEWYGLHAPEAVRGADDAARLAALVAQHGHRDGVLEALGLAPLSVGTDLDDADGATVQAFAAGIDSLHRSRARIEARLGGLMDDVAPNVTALAGPVVGARLIAQAGGLQRLATFSSGTLQTLGAETALFRHLKEGTDPPKHGILFQHPQVFQAPPWQRGAVARAMAVHLVKAARADAFTRNDLQEHLAKALADDLARIARAKARPPKRTGGGGRQQGAKGAGAGKKRGPPDKRGHAGPGRSAGPKGGPGKRGGPPKGKRGGGAPSGPAHAPGKGGRGR